jgi:hypothetical protein
MIRASRWFGVTCGCIGWLMLQIAPAGDSEVAHRRLQIHDRQLRAAAEKAIAEAARRLGDPECARILTDFVDTADRPLAKNLEALGLTAPAYLSLLWFVDGTYDTVCEPRQPRIAAFTQRGGRAVYVCRSGFLDVVRQGTAEFVIIHEMLHSLGLGENAPHPTSLAITRQVGKRCKA